MLTEVKAALRISSNAFDVDLEQLINAALLDLGIAGVDGANAIITDPLIRLAYITFCKLHDGEPDDYDRLKKSYDEQKAQLSMSSGYTTWG